MLFAALLMASSFVVVVIGLLAKNTGMALLGIAFGSSQSGLGEGSLLALSSFYPSRAALTAWSSGTGFAGIFGYAWVTIFTFGLQAPFSVTLTWALILPVAYTLVFFFVLTRTTRLEQRSA